MALVDPYSPCPCGSDKKFKWCCHKVEPHVERAQRLMDSGQNEAALAALEEGVSKYPDNPWLLLRKAVVLMLLNRVEDTKKCIGELLRRQPDHRVASTLMTRLVLETEGPIAAVSQLQQALTNATAESRPYLGRLAALVGISLAKLPSIPAALKHLELALQLNPADEPLVLPPFRSITGNPSASAWSKTSYRLSPAPEGLDPATREQFDKALGWAREGLWESAASAFELLSANDRCGALADRNLGLCRLWLADDRRAIQGLRRWMRRTGPSTEAVDLEIVCQLIDDSPGPNPVEEVRLTWPIRDRAGLLAKLEAHNSVAVGPERPLDPEDEESPEMPSFQLLDRPKITGRPGLTRQEIPQIVGDIVVGEKHVILETTDDGRLNGLTDRFVALAGITVPPAHPKTKIVGKTSRGDLALSWHWYLPDDLEPAEQVRLSHEQAAHVTAEIWPVTPQAYLGGRTPLEAAKIGNAEVPLRAAILNLELPSEVWGKQFDWARLRSQVGIGPEPEIDPATVAIDEVNLGRLVLLPVERLDDDRLIALYGRARESGLKEVLSRAGRAIVERPGIFAKSGLTETLVYTDMAQEAAANGDRAGAMDWARRGRVAEASNRRSTSAPVWDMLEIQIRAVFDDPTDWVPDLVVVLDRYRGNENASMVITARLVEIGLIRPVASAEQPDGIRIDTRPLQHLLATYGPKVTTASGVLGVSATRGEIWTPGSTGGNQGIWTPGSDQRAESVTEKRIILPGK